MNDLQFFTDEFHPVPHHYFRDGERVFSCTQILESQGITKPPKNKFALRNYRKAAQLGDYVHAAVAEVLRGEDIPITPRYAEVATRMEGFDKFLQHFPLRKTICENWMIAEWNGMRYGITPDIVGELVGTYDGGKEHCCEAIIEVKTTLEVKESHQVQTAAQAVALGRESALRGAVYLRKDGSYEFRRHDDPRDFDKWYEALTNFYRENK
jgi:hypothetical protein